MKTELLHLALSCILSTGLAVGCRDQKINDTVNANIEIARKSFDAFNRHDWLEQASYFSDSCRYLDPSYGTEWVVKSRKEKITKYSSMEMTSPDIRDDITDIFGAGNKVVIQFVSSGTAQTEQGPYSWSLPIVVVFTFKDGLIVEDATYYDN